MSLASIRRSSGAAPACVNHPELFQHPLLEEPQTARTRPQREQQSLLRAEAEIVCQSCPLRRDCLTAAVLDYDIAGYAGGTTAAERNEIRRRLDVVVRPETFDAAAGAGSGGGARVDHTAVLQLRRTHPQENIPSIAARLGCSVSTVKRHLRQEVDEPSIPVADRPRPQKAEVLNTADQVCGRRRRASYERVA